MFKYFKLKKQVVEDTAFLVGKVRKIVENYPDIIELVNKMKNINVNDPDVQKYIIEELVKYIKVGE